MRRSIDDQPLTGDGLDHDPRTIDVDVDASRGKPHLRPQGLRDDDPASRVNGSFHAINLPLEW